jgi:hypothetical protein
VRQKPKKERKKKEQMNVWMNERALERKKEQMNEWMNKWMNERKKEHTNEWTTEQNK